MLLEKDPCEGCLVSMLCEQMCPKVIKFYSQRVRKRSRQEVEQATGWYWDEDYTDDNGQVHAGQANRPIEKKKSVKNKPGMVKKLMNVLLKS